MAFETYVFATVVFFLVYVVSRRRRLAKLPPGPPRLPIIGNLLQAPASSPWVIFQTWVDEYGPLVSADFAGTSVIIIGNHDIARDLLDKRAKVYSSRPRMV
jgi:hypothetical protein